MSFRKNSFGKSNFRKGKSLKATSSLILCSTTTIGMMALNGSSSVSANWFSEYAWECWSYIMSGVLRFKYFVCGLFSYKEKEERRNSEEEERLKREEEEKARLQIEEEELKKIDREEAEKRERLEKEKIEKFNKIQKDKEEAKRKKEKEESERKASEEREKSEKIQKEEEERKRKKIAEEREKKIRRLRKEEEEEEEKKKLVERGKKLKKMSEDLEGCVFNVSVEELLEICDADSKGKLEEYFSKQHVDMKGVNILVGKIYNYKYFRFNLLDEKGNFLIDNNEKASTVSASCIFCDESKLHSFLESLSKKNDLRFKEMPVGKVLRFDVQNVGDEFRGDHKESGEVWKKLKKNEGRTLNMRTKELRLVCNDSFMKDLDEALQKYGDGEEEIKIMIRAVYNGRFLMLSLRDKQNSELGTIITKYATTNVNDLDNLAKYLDENKLKSETPFSDVFRLESFSSSDTKTYVEKIKELFEYMEKPFYMDIEELRLIVKDPCFLDDFSQENGYKEEKKVKIRICKAFNKDGSLKISVYGKGGDELCISLRHVATDDEAIGRLVEFIKNKVTECEDKDKNENEIKNENGNKNKDGENVIKLEEKVNS